MGGNSSEFEQIVADLQPLSVVAHICPLNVVNSPQILRMPQFSSQRQLAAASLFKSFIANA